MGVVAYSNDVPFDSLGIPAVFWQFLLVLWSKLEEAAWKTKTHRQIEVTTRQFGVNKNRAGECLRYLEVSGLFTIVQWGTRHRPLQPGTPTILKYLDGSAEEWEIFIDALAEQLRIDRENHHARRGAEFKSFVVDLATLVDSKRVAWHLPQQTARIWQEAAENPRSLTDDFPDLETDDESIRRGGILTPNNCPTVVQIFCRTVPR